MVNENASLIKYEPPKCDECGRKIVVLSDLCAKCAAGIELNAPSGRPNGEQAEKLALDPMNEQDKAAFEDFWSRLPGVENGFEKSLAEVSWQGCLAYLNKQAEPVAWRLNHGNGFFSEFITGMPTEVAKAHWKRMGVVIEYAYLHPAPAVAQGEVRAFEVVSDGNKFHHLFRDKNKAEDYAANLNKRYPDLVSNARVQSLYTEAPAVAVNEPTSEQLLEVAKRMVPAVEKAIGMHTAAAVNKQMMDALEIARGSLNNYTPEYAMVVDAIKAGKAAKGGV